jgi:hypothetical protein
MGLMSKMKNLTGAAPKELLEAGLLGRGIIVGIQQTSVSAGADFDPSHVCVFTVEVTLDNIPRYTTTCRQAVKATLLPQLMSPGTTVAVRADATDHKRIALSLAEEPPTVTMAPDSNTRSAAQIIEDGEPCKAIIIETLPLGVRSPRTGEDVYAFTLTVMAQGRPPFQIDVGNPVPKAAIPLLYPGSTLPARRIPDGDDRELAIDWDEALAAVGASR